MKYKLRIAISPCPNDTFISYGLIHNKVNKDSFEFEVQYLDIEQLNNLALLNQVDVIKVSTAIIPQIANNYKILNSGAALGNNCGPLLISKTDSIQITSTTKIGLPGKNTTANKLFERYYGDDFLIQQFLFSEIEDAILDNQIDAGVIIHENRFTYLEKGLKKICDLGEKWHQETQLPIPLGCFAISNNVPLSIGNELEIAIHDSIKYAINNPKEVMKFVRSHSQTMSDEVALKHIKLYVNEETLCLSKEGKIAILKFINKLDSKNNSTFDTQNLFVKPNSII